MVPQRTNLQGHTTSFNGGVLTAKIDGIQGFFFKERRQLFKQELEAEGHLNSPCTIDFEISE